MSELPFTAFDVAVVLVMAISVLVAVARGFIREVMSVGSWIAAAVVAFYFYPSARMLLATWVGPGFVADLAAGVVVFLVPLIVFRLLTGMLADAVAGVGLGGIDRLLGLAFGLLRGGFIVCAAFLLTSYLVQRDQLPPWVTQARLEPPVRGGALWLASVLPASLAVEGRATLEGALDRAQTGRILPAPVDRAPAVQPSDGQRGYRDETREQMNRLIEKVQ